MSWIQDFIDWATGSGSSYGANALPSYPGDTGLVSDPMAAAPPPIPPGETETDTSTRAGELAAKKFLYTEAAILGGICAAPALYRYATARSKGKRAKRDALMALELDNASNRAVTLLAALGPAVVFPATYITIQKMERAKIISKGLGDAVQSLMTAMAVAPVAGAAVNLASKAIPK